MNARADDVAFADDAQRGQSLRAARGSVSGRTFQSSMLTGRILVWFSCGCASAVALPALNDDIKEILGSMPWHTARIARRLDELKLYEVKRKCEEEQAAAMHWMLNLYLTHGKEWRAAGEKILKGEAPENGAHKPSGDNQR